MSNKIDLQKKYKSMEKELAETKDKLKVTIHLLYVESRG